MSNTSGNVEVPVRFHSKSADCCGRGDRAKRDERPVHPQDYCGRHEDGEEDFGFGADCRPEDVRIADRGKPQPINQEVGRESQKDQAD